MNWTEQQYNDFLQKKKKPVPTQQPVAQKPKKKAPMSPLGADRVDSYAERIYEQEYLQPMLLVGELTRIESHQSFELLPKCELCGQKLRRKMYTPDYILYFADGSVKVVELKGKVVKKLQREYQLRKHLFIEKYCIPNGWLFEEIESESLTKK